MQQTLAHRSKISLENPSNIDNFPTCQKNRLEHRLLSYTDSDG